MALVHMDFNSRVLGMDVCADVILPEGTSGQIGMEGVSGGSRWRVLYLLHGMSDDHTIWQRRTSIERYASRKGIAVVMPTTELGWYTDMVYGPKWFTYISSELPMIMRQFFPRVSDRREDNFAAGLSMGGYGALKLGLLAPEKFCYVASLSGALDMVNGLKTRVAPVYRDAFGSAEEAAGTCNDLVALAGKVPEAIRPSVYLWCGTEDRLLPHSVDMHARLKKLGYTVELETSPGVHAWEHWDEKIQTVLDRMFPEEV